MNFFTFFSPPALLRRGNERGAGWVSCSQPNAIHHNSFFVWGIEMLGSMQRMPVLDWDGHAVVIATGICVEQSPWARGCLTCSLFVVKYYQLSLSFEWFLSGFIFLSSLQVCNSCPNVFTKPHPLLPPVPPNDHFLHLPCKTLRIKVSLCLQSQWTVCMSNKLILSFPLPPHHSHDGVCASFLILIFFWLSWAVWGWVWSLAVQDYCIAWFMRHKKPVPEFLRSTMFANQ